MSVEYVPLELPGCDEPSDGPSEQSTVVDQSTGETFTVHPVADLFPMMTAEELAELAEDIRLNGQVHPVMVDASRQLIDGRNRLAACNLAGITPKFAEYTGDDPAGYILSLNVTRRHLNKGQQAMAVVRSRVFLKNTMREWAAESRLSLSRFAYAAVVVQWAPDLADGVLSGAVPLNKAYEVAQARKDAASSAEAQMERLQKEAPDLAALVAEERIGLEAALLELKKRQDEERRQRKLATDQLRDALDALDPFAWSFGEKVKHLATMAEWDTEESLHALTVNRLRRCADVLNGVADHLETE